MKQRAHKSSTNGRKGAAGPTLFEELFPEQLKTSEKEQKSLDDKVETQGLGKDKLLPRIRRIEPKQFRTQPGSMRLSLFSDTQRESAQSPGSNQYEHNPRQDVSVLVLANASKSLALSDFLRLSPQGQHIDGWASGIIKGEDYTHHIYTRSY